MHAETMI